ncbi:hypothetical protein QYM41_05440 [Kocuria sp. CPCC 205268]|uniref:hypothetical protein n=1 Tax=Kocuria oxytropis TaxID=3058913 RepID=UPI0034D64AAB
MVTAVDVFVDTVGCFDGVCGAVSAPRPWFVGLVVLCLVLLWSAARATTAVVSSRSVTRAGTQLLGPRYGTLLTALLFAGWMAVAFGLSVPALGTVRDPFAWTVMVPLHATLLLGVPVLVAGLTALAGAVLRRPDRFRPAALPLRAAAAGAAVVLPAAWWLAGSSRPELVALPVAPAGAAGAVGGPLGTSVGALWWVADRMADPAVLAVLAVAGAGYVLLPRTGTAALPAVAPRQPVAVVASGALRRGGTARAVRVPEAPAGPAAAATRGPVAAAVRASTLVTGAALAVSGSAAVLAAVGVLLAAVPFSGLLVVLTASGFVALGLLVRAR